MMPQLPSEKCAGMIQFKACLAVTDKVFGNISQQITNTKYLFVMTGHALAAMMLACVCDEQGSMFLSSSLVKA